MFTPLSVDKRVWPSISRIEGVEEQLGNAIRITRVQFKDEKHCSAKCGSGEFLGFDVADSFFLSTLSNCAFNDSGFLATKEEWWPKINEWHLFGLFGDAKAFSLFSDAKWAPEHAPTFVYGIWLDGGEGRGAGTYGT